MSGFPRTIVLSLCALALAACAPDAAEEEMEVDQTAEMEQPMDAAAEESALAAYAGTWEATTILESGDTVSYTFTATADPNGWMIMLPDRDPMPLRVVSSDGGTLVTEVGPYESLLREGVQVTVRQTSQMQGDRMTGTMEARYEGGEGPQVVAGTVEGTRGM